jgi:hypothetical protein
MRVRCATIDTSLAAGDHHRVGQPIEGNMLRGLNWGTANAKAITVSFTAWASSGMTLPFCIRNPGNTRSWLASFAVTTTPQRFTFTIPGDTVGAWAYTNAVGMWFEIGLAVGTTYQAPATGWNSGDYITLAGMTNFMSSTSNMLYLKDVQLEEGSVATPFERRAYGSELLLCQRYFWKILAAANAERVPGSTGMAWSTNTTMHSLPTRVTMRSAPSIMATDLQINNNSAVFGDVTNFAASAASPDALNVNAQSSGTTWTVNSLVMLQFKTAGVSYIMATAEL